MTQKSYAFLWLALGALLTASIAVQFAMFPVASDIGGAYMETAHLVIPYAVAGIAAVTCLQVALILAGAIVVRVKRGRVFSAATDALLRGVAVAGILAAVVVVGTAMHLLVTVGGGPGVIMGCLAATLVTVAGVAVVQVARGVVRHGRQIEDELRMVV